MTDKPRRLSKIKTRSSSELLSEYQRSILSSSEKQAVRIRQLTKQLNISVNFGKKLIGENESLEQKYEELLKNFESQKLEFGRLEESRETERLEYERTVLSLNREKKEIIFSDEENRRKLEKVTRDYQLLDLDYRRVFRTNDSLRSKSKKSEKKTRILSKRLSSLEIVNENLDLKCHNLSKTFLRRQNSMNVIVIRKKSKCEEKGEEEIQDEESLSLQTSFPRRKSVSFGRIISPASNSRASAFWKLLKSKDVPFNNTDVVISSPVTIHNQEFNFPMAPPSDYKKEEIHYLISKFRDSLVLLKMGMESDLNQMFFFIQKIIKKNVKKEILKYEKKVEELQELMGERELKFAKQLTSTLQQFGILEFYSRNRK